MTLAARYIYLLKYGRNYPVLWGGELVVAVHQRTPHKVDITVKTKVGGKLFNYQTIYSVYGNGEIEIDTALRPIQESGKELMRFGMTMTMPAAFDQFSWYGRGPFENYSDRATSAAVGLYSGSVWNQYHPYIRPQETGNKTDVRWMAVTGDNGYGLLVKGAPTFSGSALQLANKDLYYVPKQNKHGADMQPRDFITLNIDKRQAGVGGDNSWSEKGLAHSEHRLPWQFYRFKFSLRPFGPQDDLEKLKVQRVLIETTN